jgi:hypothetical protein
VDASDAGRQGAPLRAEGRGRRACLGRFREAEGPRSPRHGWLCGARDPGAAGCRGRGGGQRLRAERHLAGARPGAIARGRAMLGASGRSTAGRRRAGSAHRHRPRSGGRPSAGAVVLEVDPRERTRARAGSSAGAAQRLAARSGRGERPAISSSRTAVSAGAHAAAHAFRPLRALASRARLGLARAGVSRRSPPARASALNLARATGRDGERSTSNRLVWPGKSRRAATRGTTPAARVRAGAICSVPLRTAPAGVCSSAARTSPALRGRAAARSAALADRPRCRATTASAGSSSMPAPGLGPCSAATRCAHGDSAWCSPFSRSRASSARRTPLKASRLRWVGAQRRPCRRGGDRAKGRCREAR